jgi:hypothetical protein
LCCTKDATKITGTSYKFDFGKGKVQTGFTQVLPVTSCTPEKGYGIDLGTTATANDSSNGKKLYRMAILPPINPSIFQ